MMMSHVMITEMGGVAFDVPIQRLSNLSSSAAPLGLTLSAVRSRGPRLYAYVLLRAAGRRGEKASGFP